ncbi:RraA family protein [Alisedimentitalea sp. MJ-SS2]|uniref:RraA family protein n=1 Tax=Aliisedimentitalea sp. MJ-SS2 TaxID=3049795 RepID=UPI00290CDCDD|nr:RraA family protein [Alisedimentitalea sp. MJ-SS2]MDU8929181.1 RraA family protein [Alisedimentitalea sp. MJ-SS2]
MIEAPPTLTIKTSMRRPSDAQIAAFQGVPTGFVVDALFGGGALSSKIQPIGGGRDLRSVAAGPALTADCGPADVLATFAALKFIQGGEVVVSAFAAHSGCAAAGDRLIGMMKNNGAAGFVTDGPVRDYDGIVPVGLPVWCSGLTPASPNMTGPGSIGFPVQIGGQEVETGDMIVADQDGVVVVSYERLDEAIQNLERIKEMEQTLDAEVAGGLKVPVWVEEFLASDKTVLKG